MYYDQGDNDMPMYDAQLQQVQRYLEDQVNTTTSNTTSSLIPYNDNDVDDEKSFVDILSAVLSNIFLFVLIFGLSATVDCRALRKQFENKFAISTGLVMQYLIMPILGCVSVIIFSKFGLTQAAGISLLIVLSSPGGSYSNWWCSTFNADLALSVAMTTVSSLLSIVFLPLNLFVYTYFVYGISGETDSSSIVKSVNFGTLFLSLGVVLAAIVSGLAAGYKWDTPWFHNAANKLGTISGIFLVTFSFVLSSGASGAESTLWNQEWYFYVSVVLPCVGGIILASICAWMVRLSPPEVIAIAIECCYQNTGIATSVAITMYSNKEDRAQAVSVPLLYGIVTAISILIFCLVSWKMGWTKAPANEKFCIVITKSYEIGWHGTEDENQIESDDSSKVEDDAEMGGMIIEESTNDAVADLNETNAITPIKFDKRNRMDTGDSNALTVVSSETSATPRDVDNLRVDDDIEEGEVEENKSEVIAPMTITCVSPSIPTEVSHDDKSTEIETSNDIHSNNP